jgi:hypothetical protein
VTRDEWLNGTDPLEMVNSVAGRLTDRKLRLFLVACCRRLWHLPGGRGLRDAAQAAERFADGRCSQEEMERAAHKEVDSTNQEQPWPWLSEAGAAVFIACQPPDHLGGRCSTFAGRYWRGSYVVMRGVDAAAEAVAHHAASVEGSSRNIFEQAVARERVEQCHLLRDAVGDLIGFDSRWRTPLVLSLATAAYEERVALDPSRAGWLTLDPLRLTILADALEEAGADPVLLDHLREPGPHVRGCWVVDYLTARG